MLDHDFMALDAPALMLGVLAALSCSLLGNILFFRRQVMLGDALSHSVFPGLVIAYLLGGSLAPPLMFLGASAAVLCALLAIRLLETAGRVPSSAAMAIVLSIFFALGVFLLENQVGGGVHLDTEHALYGALELSYWPEPFTWASLPLNIKSLGFLTILNILLFFFFFKEIRLILFNSEYAGLAGFSPQIFISGVLLLITLVLVGCFDSVGVILVLAFLVCPAACARMLCDRLEQQILYSAVIGISMAVFGYIAATRFPLWLGWEHSLSAAGVIALTLGLLQVTLMLWGPRRI
ncbi:MAG: metal ABC transporter permease [Alphaproteobacteria bacterium]|nr:metal ABC transporter permease [Alphaproteobacteria bacterium]